MSGFIPLFGLKQTNAELDATLKVTGLPPEGDGNPRATTDLEDVKVLLEGTQLPFGKDNFAQWFPNTVTMTPQGKVLKNNAPNIEMSVHLPGLDVRRLPDISFLAIEFPVEGIEVGKSWTYTRDFADSPVTYTVTPSAIDGNTADLALVMTEDYEDKEGDSFEAVKNPKDAVYDVRTHVLGRGTVKFDLKQGLLSKMHLDADAVGDVINIETKGASKRDLKTTLDVELKS